jgi:hypothetical protein
MEYEGPDGKILVFEDELLFALIADYLEHGFGVGGLLERLAEFGAMQQFGDIGEGMEMFLELALRDEEEHDQVNGLIVERVEVDAGAGTAKGSDDFIDEVGGGVRDADTEADTGAHRGFALFDDGGDGVMVFLLDAAGAYEVINELINRFPTIPRVQVRDDLLFGQNIA